MSLLTGLFLSSLFVIAAFAAPASHFTFEILEKNETSIKVRFRTSLMAGKYYVNVAEKYLADVPATYYTTFVDSDRRNEYFYIDTGNTLEPGTLYEVLVIPRTGRSGSIDVFTDCDIYTFSCTKYGRPICLSSSSLCDGVDDCTDGADELKREDNQTCLAQLPERPTPPPPPSDTACMLERVAAIRAGASSWDAQNCEPDGSYPTLRCELLVSYTCHCANPENNEILASQPNYDYFSHYSFFKDCETKRANVKKGARSN